MLKYVPPVNFLFFSLIDLNFISKLSENFQRLFIIYRCSSFPNMVRQFQKLCFSKSETYKKYMSEVCQCFLRFVEVIFIYKNQ